MRNNDSNMSAQLILESSWTSTQADLSNYCARNDTINPIGFASATSVEFRGIKPRMYIEDLFG